MSNGKLPKCVSKDTLKVTNMDSIFSGCSSLITLDLSSFGASNVEDSSSMFWYDYSLKSVKVSRKKWNLIKDLLEKSESGITDYEYVD